MSSLNIKDDMIFIAADGDGIGRQVGKAVIANDTEKLHKISARIDAAQDFILHWAKQHDGIKVSGGGDEFTAAIPKEAIEDVEGLRKDIEHAFDYTISVGIGKSLSEAGTALLVAKLRGKNQIVHFTDELKKEIKKAKRRVKEKRASQEEYKLAEAYLEKAENKMADEKQKSELQDCQYCEQTDGADKDHCKYCHDVDATLEQEPCPYCAAPEAQMAQEDDCQYCKEKDDKKDCQYCKEGEDSQHEAEQNPKIQSPDSNNETASAGSAEEKQQYDQMEMNPPTIGKPEIGNNSSPAGMGDANPAYDTAAAPEQPRNAEADEEQANDGIIPEEGAHSKEALQAIAERIESETADGKPDDKQVANQIDDTEIVGDAMEGNVSRPENFDENVPGDLGLDEEHAGESGPDLSEVLQEGLDNQADNIQKEKVREMVGQALEGFKRSKDVLEKAKEQAPELYAASIMMLKAMIEMAKMLGLGEAQAEEQPQEGEQPAQEENEWKDPFPTHPDHGGERKPGHAAGQEAAADAPQQ